MTINERLQNLDEFTRAYIECTLWSSTAYGHPNEKKRGDSYDSSFQDEGMGPEKLSRKALNSIIAECKDFQNANAADLAQWPSRREWSGMTLAGHDFWLTRNGHGAGFWDRGEGELGARLTRAAKVYGSVDLYYYRGRIWS